jgi:hypothetical protein
MMLDSVEIVDDGIVPHIYSIYVEINTRSLYCKGEVSRRVVEKHDLFPFPLEGYYLISVLSNVCVYICHILFSINPSPHTIFSPCQGGYGASREGFFLLKKGSLLALNPSPAQESERVLPLTGEKIFSFTPRSLPSQY